MVMVTTMVNGDSNGWLWQWMAMVMAPARIKT